MNRHMKRVAVMLMAAAVLLLFAACGDGKKGSSGMGSGMGVTAIGTTTCFKCHADNNNPAGLKKPFGDTQAVAANGLGWLNSRHANKIGGPKYADADWVSSCASCHDPNHEGSEIASFYFDTGLNTFGTTNRPITGCESCHGNGGNHYGVGPLEYNNPGAARCALCHGASFPHSALARYKEKLDIYADYLGSAHAGSRNANVLVTGTPANVTAICSRCHTDEGARRYINTYDGSSGGQSSYAGAVNALEAAASINGASAIECKTCHDAHNPNRFLAENGPAGAALTNITTGAWSAEFATCNTCHQLLNADGTKNTAGYHNPAVNTAAAADSSQIITDTHFATKGSWTGAGGVNINAIAGYYIDFADKRACTNCHNPHQANVTINRQWHASKHGGDFTAAGAWAHYDWKASNRQACQRCHTTSGAVTYLDTLIAGGTYGTGNIAATANSTAPEMLQCQGCHTDNKGTLRNPGALTVTYYGDAQALADFVTTAAVPVTYPDLAGSNICLSCHVGRESGSSIKASTKAFTNGTSFINSHYLSAGGTVFAQTGYTYYTATATSDPYANPSFYKHDTIGLAASKNIGGSNGPCVGCHMTSTADAATNYGSHRFLPVQKDSAGAITAMTTTVCANCHAGKYSMTPAELEHQMTLFNAGIGVLKDMLANSGFYFVNTSPYFYTTAAGTAAQTVWGSSKAVGQQNMGAAFNYNLLEHDPGAYAHNRYYAKRLIYDSIDWLDDKTMNHSVPGTLDGIAASSSYSRADAIAYLIDSASATDPLTGVGAAQTGGRP